MSLRPGEIVNPHARGMRKANIEDIYRPTRVRHLISSVTLPSQYNSYAVCTEFARDWFLNKFPTNFFNSVYVDGSKTFDQFRQLSKINQQMKRTNPVLGIAPSINMEFNREFIDMNMEIGGYLRRSRMEGLIFSDHTPGLGLHLAVQFKTIMMTFVYKMRVDTKAQQLDLVEYIKHKHRAGLTENQYIPLDIHVPKKIISQIAYTNNMLSDDFKRIKDPDKMLKYLNSHSMVPFLYKRRNATGTDEFFIRIENCGVHLKCEMPNADESGDRQEHEHMSFMIDFSVEIQMTAPYCYTYYSETEQNIINSTDIVKDETGIILMKAARADFPDCNEVGWNKILTSEYVVENEDLLKPVEISFISLLEGELMRITEYTKSVALNPSLFIDFIIFNDGRFCDYDIDWDKYIITVKNKCTHPGFAIAMYVNMSYVNETKIHHNFAEGFNNPDSFQLTSRIGKLE